jgi:hypothetical protein
MRAGCQTGAALTTGAFTTAERAKADVEAERAKALAAKGEIAATLLAQGLRREAVEAAVKTPLPDLDL